MDSIDALGSRTDRHRAFTGDLLAETEDEGLQAIVADAIRDLAAPIALVNLVLEKIQFFKAHYGLPPDLAAARGTERDVSFCQFVVRDGQPFEVSDAEHDSRVPQHLVKQFGIRSYPGMPVVANDIVVGSLCVIDTKPRKFSQEDHRTLQSLADLVNERLAALGQQDRGARSSLVDQAAAPALAELPSALTPIGIAAASGRMGTAALGTFVRLVEHQATGGKTPPKHFMRTLKAAQEALDDCENDFCDIEASAGDAEDARIALEHVLTESSSTRLSEISTSGRELARQSTAAIGGVFLPELAVDPVVAAPRPLAVALVTACLSIVAARLAELSLAGGIRMRTDDLGPQALVAIEATELSRDTVEDIVSKLKLHTGGHPAVAVQAEDGAIRLLFAVVQEGG